MSSPSSNKVIAHRVAVKKASRKRDAELLLAGYSLEKLQHENSMLPSDFFKKMKINNFAEVVGR